MKGHGSASAILRAEGPGTGEALDLIAGNIHVDLAAYRAYVAGVSVQLTYQEFELLRLLVTRRDRIVPFDELIEDLWHGAQISTKRRLGVVICRLRAKLTNSRPYRIETIRGRGYGLVVPVSSPQEATR
jgi:DNA-binding response OmpR family regulator